MEHDLLIVGAGPAGLSLARALRGSGLRTTLIEQSPLESLQKPAFDGREIALTQHSAEQLRQLGLWPRLGDENIAPLKDALVLDGGFGRAQSRMRIGHDLSPLDIVLVNTAAGAAYGDPDYIHRGCGMGEAATLYLTERGVKVVGTDAWSWDAPFSHTARRWALDHDPKIIWEGHKAGRLREYYQIEKLTNLEVLPATGFTLSCFPVKIAGASAGWIRAVAILD